MGRIFNLESFDDSNVPVQKNHPEYTRGFSEGQAAGQDAASKLEGELLQNAASILESARFTYAEARQATLADLEVVMSATLSQILPTLATAGLVETLRDHLRNAFENSAKTKIHLSVPSALVPMFEKVAAESGGNNIVIRADPKLGDHAVWFTSEAQNLCIDFEHALSAAQTALQCLQTPIQGTAKND